jgi:tetraacyldisaccharide-1-P 4'-kinase
MLASNLPGVAVVVDRERVKAGRYAIKRLGCDTIILDDGFQYQKLKHSVEVVLSTPQIRSATETCCRAEFSANLPVI